MAAFVLNRSIALRLAILCLVPMIALIAIGSNRLYGEYTTATEARFALKVLDAAPMISSLVHELQKERGISAGFIGSKGKTFADVIGARRADTEAALKIFRETAPQPVGRLAIPEFAGPYERAHSALAKLEEMRGKVDSFELTVPEMAGYYTPMIADLLDMVESVSFMVEDGHLLHLMSAYTGLLQGKERAGIERAMGAAGFGSGTFKEGIYRNFIRLGAMQDIMFANFHRHANADDIAFFDEQLSGSVQDDVVALRKLAQGAPFGSDISGVTGPQWFAASTARIDALKAVEDRFVMTLHGDAQALVSRANATFWVLSAIMLVLITVSIGLSWIVYRSIVPPISRLVESMRRLANNDVSIELNELTREDEIGEMARAVGVFKENAIDRNRLEESAQQERDRERRRQSHVEGLVTNFREIVNETLKSSNAKTQDMRSASERLADIAANAAGDAQSARSATGSASENVQLMAAAAEELSASIGGIATQTNEANTLMADTEAKAIATNEDVGRLSEAAEQIGSVVNLIRDIAEQTNLLALNATIEAARAGEAGRGFAVVATEVKELASQTAKATEEIATQVSGIQGSTQNAVSAILAITESMKEVRGLTASIAKSVDEQLSATQEISQAVASASSGTTTASGNVDSVAGSIEKTSEFAAEVDQTSLSLADATQQLAREVERFLNDVAKDVEERRKASRKHMREVVVICHDGRSIRSEMLDASTSGARIASHSGLSVGDRISLKLSNGMTHAATVARVGDDDIGIKFDKELSGIEELIAA